MKDVVRTIIIILFFLSPSYCWAQGKVTRHAPTKEIGNYSADTLRR